MTTVLSLFLIAAIGLTLFIIGKCFKDYTFGILGGFIVFLLGTNTLINPISGIENFLSIIIGIALFGIGAYVWVRGTLDSIEQGSTSDDY